MLAFPQMLVPAAQKAGIKVPEDPDDFVREEYPHFAIFLAVQLGSPMPRPTSHWENAEIVAAVPEDKIFTVTVQDLINAGLEIGHSSRYA